MPLRSLTARLRALRAAHSRAVGATIAAFPGLEPAFIVAGRWLARHSRILGTLYWFAQDDLLPRLQRSGRRFRRLAVAGIEMDVDITGGTGRLHYFYDQPYEPELSQAVRERLEPGDVFIDVGANVGYFSVLAGRIVGPKGRVVAFEPHPEALTVLRQAVAANQLTGVIDIVETAVGAETGTTRLFLSEDSVLSTTDPLRSPARAHYGFPRSIDVAQTTLDRWVGQRPDLVARVRAIKIDVEGTEADVLEGMQDIVDRCPAAAILCETTAGGAADQYLRQRGYQVSALDVRNGAFGNYCYERGAQNGPVRARQGHDPLGAR